MTASFANDFDAFGQWRLGAESSLAALARFAAEQGLLDDASAYWFDVMRQRLAGEKLTVAFVAEFSRGKSELINALFFAQDGGRLMPASAGRTTMCPVELAYTPDEPVGLALLPIETRATPQSLAEYRQQSQAWTWHSLDLHAPQRMAELLQEVVRTQRVTLARAQELGFGLQDEAGASQAGGDDELEIPVWRHARINFPHPLLKRGLVVLDTPGLNAIGTEAELTLGLLPQAHATVFILSADAGVSQSDLATWQQQLHHPVLARYVVLNKIDTLRDPLSTPEAVDALIERQCADVARVLKLEGEHVFPISARQALAARVQGDAQGLVASRIAALEHALSEGLLNRRREQLASLGGQGVERLSQQVERRLGEMRRLYADQLVELRGLRGKSTGKVQLMIQRVQAEANEFEQCTARLAAMRSIHARMLRHAVQELSADRVRQEAAALHQLLASGWLPLGAKKAFIELCGRLRDVIEQAQLRSDEIHAMLVASYAKLNAEFGFALDAPAPPHVRRYVEDLNIIESNYVQYLGLSQAFKLAQPSFQEQFRRMLVSRLRVVFETASNDIELWNKTASAQVDSQLRERRRNFKKRYETLDRIQSASHELDQRLQEVHGMDERVLQMLTRWLDLVGQAREVLAKPNNPATLPSADESTRDELARA